MRLPTFAVRIGQTVWWYYTKYHADQFSRALTLHGTPHTVRTRAEEVALRALRQ
jgi:hypothetical protein